VEKEGGAVGHMQKIKRRKRSGPLEQNREISPQPDMALQKPSE
jgi:hypothetical protein